MRHSWLLVLAIIAGLSFPLGWNLALPVVVALGWKGAGVALLAIWAAMHPRDLDGWLLAAVMALCALGDVLLELSPIAGGAAFLLGHAAAIVLYQRNRRPAPTASQKLLCILLVPLVAVAAFEFPADRATAPAIGFYGLLLGAMAASAWISRFPRYRTGIGAMLFVASDLLIFARMGPLAGVQYVGLAIWLSYFLGQAMIAVGVRQGLDRR